MKIYETHPRGKGFILWGHCQNILDDPRIYRINDFILFSALSKCSFPIKLNDGNVMLKNTSVGSRVTYSCSSPSYVLVGAPERTCMYDGRWSGSTPLCFSQPSGMTIVVVLKSYYPMDK